MIESLSVVQVEPLLLLTYNSYFSTLTPVPPALAPVGADHESGILVVVTLAETTVGVDMIAGTS